MFGVYSAGNKITIKKKIKIEEKKGMERDNQSRYRVRIKQRNRPYIRVCNGDTLQIALDTVFLCLLAFYLFYLFEASTTFQLKFPDNFDETFLRLFASVACARASINCHFDLKKLAVGTGIVILSELAFHSSQLYFLLFIGYGIIGCLNMEYHVVLKVYTVLIGALLFITIMCALTGTIKNLVYVDTKNNLLRSSMGIGYPTDFASYILFFVMILWCAFDKANDVWMLAISLLSFLIARYIADSKTSQLCSLLLLISILYHLFGTYFIEKKHRFIIIQKIVNILLLVAFPVCATFFFWVMHIYIRGSELGLKLNTIMSDRIRLAVEALNRYGIKAWGTPFTMNGNGLSLYSRGNYNFIDSSYPMILIRYGVIVFLAVGALWVYITRKAIKMNNRKIALCMGIIAVHALSEHHFMELDYNIFLLLPLAKETISQREDTKENGIALTIKDKKVYKWRTIIINITVLSVAFIAFLTAPRVISFLRTLTNEMNLANSQKGKLTSIMLWAMVLFVASTLFYCIYRFMCHLFLRESLNKIVLIFFILCLVGGCVFVRKADHLIDSGVTKYSQQIKADEPALNIVTSVKGSNVYVDKIPNIYGRYFEGIQSSVMTGDDLARLNKATVIMDADYDSQCFTSRGFYYTEISDYHCLYTNDPNVITALQNEGYTFSDYYSKKKYISLSTLAEKNNHLIRNEKDGLLLLNWEYSVTRGTSINLNSGNYVVHYTLSIPSTDYEYDYNVCRVVVYAYDKTTVLASKDVLRSEFDENGHATVELPFVVWPANGMSDVEITIFDTSEQKLSVHAIYYQKTSNL